jgi:large subunit ribosomal protein L15
MKNLPKVKKRSKKRVGRGYGSGKGGHTSGRGQKGQKSRSNIHILFEGVKVKKSLIKRLPLKRGKGKFNAKKKPIIVKTDYLNVFPSGSKVDLESLVKHGIVNEKEAKEYGVKILGNGKVEKKLTVAVPISNSAAKGIEKAGGKINISDSNR